MVPQSILYPNASENPRRSTIISIPQKHRKFLGLSLWPLMVTGIVNVSLPLVLLPILSKDRINPDASFITKRGNGNEVVAANLYGVGVRIGIYMQSLGNDLDMCTVKENFRRRS